MIFSADLPYGKKLFVKESFAEFIFGIPHPKTLQNIFLRHLCIFCMLLLKTASFINLKYHLFKVENLKIIVQQN